MVTGNEFMLIKVCVITIMYLFEGKKSSFFYHRSRTRSQWDSVEILGARSRKGSEVGGLARVAVTADWQRRARSMQHRISDASVTVLGACFGASPTVLHIFPALRALILLT